VLGGGGPAASRSRHRLLTSSPAGTRPSGEREGETRELVGTSSEAAMGLSRVWLQTLDDGLVRADQVVGVVAHRTASFAGKPARWLLDAVLPVNHGAGGPTQWQLGALHRTLLQTSVEPAQAVPELTRLLARLDAQDAAGIVSVHRGPDGSPGAVEYRFASFAAAEADGAGAVTAAGNGLGAGVGAVTRVETGPGAGGGDVRTVPPVAGRRAGGSSLSEVCG